MSTLDRYKGFEADSEGGYVINVTVTDGAIDFLEDLAQIGVFGMNIEDVAARFVDEGIRRCLRQGWIDRDGPNDDEEDEDEEDEDT